MTSKLRLAATGLAALACVGLLSACIQAPPTIQPSPSESAAKPALELLHDAAAKAEGQPYRYALNYGALIKADGYRDATGSTAERNVVLGSQAQGTLRFVDMTLYAKFDLGSFVIFSPDLATINNKWLIGDQKKLERTVLVKAVLPVGESLTLNSFVDGVVTADFPAPPSATANPSGSPTAGGLVSVAADETLITGTIDLAKSSPLPVPVAQINLLGDKKVVPFTATLDKDGFLSKIAVTMPAIGAFPAGEVSITFSDYGVTSTITAPADAIEAPDFIYTYLP